jgi:hypothetical protein
MRQGRTIEYVESRSKSNGLPHYIALNEYKWADLDYLMGIWFPGTGSQLEQALEHAFLYGVGSDLQRT